MALSQKDILAIATTYNSFADNFEDKEMRLRTLEKLLVGVSSEAVCEAAQRFCSGEVKGQSTRKAPTVPEFVQEAKRIQRDVLPYRNRRSELPAPEPTRTKGSSPYEIGIAKMERDFEGYTLLKKNIALHVFNERARAGEYPPGTRWQAGRVYVPDSVRTQATESA